MIFVEKVLGSKAKIKLLRIFYSNPKREFTLYDIKREFNLSPGTMAPVLKSLVESRALLSRRAGKTILYQLNLNNLFIRKIVEIFDSEKSLLLKKAKEFSRRIVKSNILSIILFGSVATGNITELSDIDLLIIYDRNYVSVKKNVDELTDKYLDEEILISPIILSKKEVKDMLGKFDSFILRVESEGKVLYGRPLEKMKNG
jgi:predicted nucleotidyltransferase